MKRWDALSKEKKIPEVEIIQTETIQLKEPIILFGSLSAGLVGRIALMHVIEQLKMGEIAHIQSKYVPPSVIFTDGVLKHPFRIYSNIEGTLCAILCEVPLYIDGINSITTKLLDWAEENKVKELVILGAVPIREIPRQREVFLVAEVEKFNDFKENYFKNTPSGIIQGIAGSILNECLTRKIIGVALLTQSVAFIPDPKGAAGLINTLNDMYNLKIDVKELLKESGKIKNKLKELIKIHKRMIESEEKTQIPREIYG